MEIDLLQKKKTPHDLLIDLEKKFIIKKPNQNGKYTRQGVSNFAYLLGIDNKRLINYINFGIPKGQKEFIKQINDLASIEGIKKYKTWSYQFDRNTFSENAFYKLFKNVRNIPVKKNEQILGRAGLYMVFPSSGDNNYIIPSYIVAAYDKKEMKRCLKKLGTNIKSEIRKFQSLKHFYFIFLSLKKIEIKTL